jgi:hypothetical protein
MNNIQTHYTSSQSLYFRFLIDVKKISPLVCPIRNTPHYSFAREVLGKALKGEFSPMPENSFYGEYCKWEAFCIEGNMGHSPRHYYQKLADWVKNFDILSNLPQVIVFDDDKYYLFDGVHRTVFMTVLVDLGLFADKIPVQIIIPEKKTIPVQGITRIEEWLTFK